MATNLPFESWIEVLGCERLTGPEVRSDMENWRDIRQQVLANGLNPRTASEKHMTGWHTLKKFWLIRNRLSTGRVVGTMA